MDGAEKRLFSLAREEERERERKEKETETGRENKKKKQGCDERATRR